MKITLFGYGKMGKEIEKIALERKHEIVNIFDPRNGEAFSIEKLEKSDVAIDFSVPQTATENINFSYFCFCNVKKNSSCFSFFK